MPLVRPDPDPSRSVAVVGGVGGVGDLGAVGRAGSNFGGGRGVGFLGLWVGFGWGGIGDDVVWVAGLGSK